MKAVPDDYNDLEEFELNPPVADLIRRGYVVWRVVMLRNGDVESATPKGTKPYDVTSVRRPWVWERSTAPGYAGQNKPDALVIHAWAKTQKQATKIANEKRAQMIASGEWK